MSCNAAHPWRIQQFHDATHLSGAFNSFMLVSLADRGSPANYSNHVMCMVDLWHSTKVRHYGHNSAGRRHYSMNAIEGNWFLTWLGERC